MPLLQKKKPVEGEAPRNFELQHAQNILDLGRSCPPVTWELVDPKYKLDEAGKIIEIPDREED